jgi:predicted PurR-regulated permease PerM
MIWLIIFLMVCSFGLGLSLNYVIKYINELNQQIKRLTEEEEKFVAKFKQSIDTITKEQLTNKPVDVNSLKANLKKKH